MNVEHGNNEIIFYFSNYYYHYYYKNILIATMDIIVSTIPKLIIRNRINLRSVVWRIEGNERSIRYLMVVRIASTTRFPRAIFFFSLSRSALEPWRQLLWCSVLSPATPPRFHQENWSIIFHASSTQAPWHWKTLLNGYSPDEWFSMDAHRLFHSASITSLASFDDHALCPPFKALHVCFRVYIF